MQSTPVEIPIFTMRLCGAVMPVLSNHGHYARVSSLLPGVLTARPCPELANGEEGDSTAAAVTVPHL